jgi:phosphatidylinositol glycan class Z
LVSAKRKWNKNRLLTVVITDLFEEIPSLFIAFAVRKRSETHTGTDQNCHHAMHRDDVIKNQNETCNLHFINENDDTTMNNERTHTTGGGPNSWILYAILLLLRVFVGPFLPGYVHPDEFFQGGQELWFGCPTPTPWEFDPEHAIRSVFPPTILTWIPLQVYAWILGKSLQGLSGREVLVIPRLACSVLSVIAVDFGIWSLSTNGKMKGGVPISVLIMASAWPTFAILNRPFSNGLETYLFALLMAVVLSSSKATGSRARELAIGVICSLGVFTRFTFVFFAIPVMVYFLWNTFQTSPVWTRAVQKIFIAAVSFAVVSMSIMYLDTQFYASRDPENESTSFVCAPLNALLYNSKVTNLKDHGIHPRWTHALVNMFLLYGPLTCMVYLSLLTGTGTIINNHSKTNNSSSDDESSTISMVCRWTIIVGLGFLSLAPHQEPRFLMPLLVPVALLGAKRLQSTAMLTIWIVFNAILLVFFGLLHQSGVVQSLLATGTVLADRDPSALIYFHTYMPPTFLARSTPELTCTRGNEKDANEEGVCFLGSDVCRGIHILDLKGASVDVLRDEIRDHLDCTDEVTSAGTYIHLAISPLTAEINGSRWSFSSSCDVPDYDCKILFSSKPHLSTEDLPPFSGSISNFYEGMALNIYELSCPMSEES